MFNQIDQIQDYLEFQSQQAEPGAIIYQIHSDWQVISTAARACGYISTGTWKEAFLAISMGRKCLLHLSAASEKQCFLLLRQVAIRENYLELYSRNGRSFHTARFSKENCKLLICVEHDELHKLEQQYDVLNNVGAVLDLSFPEQEVA